MEPNVIIGLAALLVALVFYSLGAIGAFRAKTITKKQVMFIFIGFAFDVIATAAMMSANGWKFDLEPMADLLHTVVALVAMFGMLAAAVIGQQAVAKANSALQAKVAKLIMVPWALWVLVFLWGMAARGPMGK